MIMPFWQVWGLSALVFASGWVANASSDDEWGAFNTNDLANMVRTSNIQHDYSRDDIYIDDENQRQWIYDGSGDMWMDDDDDLDYSGDEDDESSGDTTPCLKLHHQMKSQGLTGLYIPQCTASGEFERVQCRAATSVCWCVDISGREISGTKIRKPDMPNCDNIVIDPIIPEPKRPSGSNVRPPPEEDNTPIVASTEIDNRIDIMPEVDVEIDTAEPRDNAVEMLPSKGDNHVHSSMVMSQPGILAGIIGGALVGLLCAVLLVMFIVYRMRKKDEGSYALDERKHSPSMHQYARAPTKEFYA